MNMKLIMNPEKFVLPLSTFVNPENILTAPLLTQFFLSQSEGLSDVFPFDETEMYDDDRCLVLHHFCLQLLINSFIAWGKSDTFFMR